MSKELLPQFQLKKKQEKQKGSQTPKPTMARNIEKINSKKAIYAMDSWHNDMKRIGFKTDSGWNKQFKPLTYQQNNQYTIFNRRAHSTFDQNKNQSDMSRTHHQIV